MCKRFALGFSLSLLILGCGDQFEKEKNQTSDPQSVSVLELKDHISSIVENGEEPEKYVVHFGWPRIKELAEVRIKTDKVLGVLKSDQTVFTHIVSHNQIITYVFEVIGSTGEVIDKFSKKITIPIDMVVSELNNELKEDQNIKVNRLYISNIPLKTNGFKVRIDVAEIISDKGIIESFSENARSPDNTDGRSAGELIVNAKIGIGDLKIIMRGEDGGNGSKGPVMGPAATGARGTPGSWVCDGGIQSVEPIQIQRRICSCDHYGSNGGQGSNGVKGNTGLPGKIGGDSGYAKVSIDKGDGLNLTSYSIPGAAGLGGPGGDGQPGGQGGPGYGEQCTGGKGEDGGSGPAGDPGSIGAPGKKGTFCTYIASEKFNECT